MSSSFFSHGFEFFSSSFSSSFSGGFYILSFSPSSGGFPFVFFSVHLGDWCSRSVWCFQTKRSHSCCHTPISSSRSPSPFNPFLPAIANLLHSFVQTTARPYTIVYYPRVSIPQKPLHLLHHRMYCSSHLPFMPRLSFNLFLLSSESIAQ